MGCGRYKHSVGYVQIFSTIVRAKLPRLYDHAIYIGAWTLDHSVCIKTFEDKDYPQQAFTEAFEFAERVNRAIVGEIGRAIAEADEDQRVCREADDSRERPAL